MNKTKIAIYLALIFVAGAVAGGAISYKTAQRPDRPHHRGPRPSAEEFANHLFGKMTERLQLTPEQVEKVKPIFWEGFQEVRSIQEQSLREVEEAIRRNHEQIGRELSEEQRLELHKMDQERQEFLNKREGGMRDKPRDKKMGQICQTTSRG